MYSVTNKVHLCSVELIPDKDALGVQLHRAILNGSVQEVTRVLLSGQCEYNRVTAW